MYFFYRILTAAGMFILAPYYALRGWRRGERSGALRERLGSLPPEIIARAHSARVGHIARIEAPKIAGGPESTPDTAGAIWIHAVSVGEVLAAKPLADGLKRRFPHRAS